MVLCSYVALTLCGVTLIYCIIGLIQVDWSVSTDMTRRKTRTQQYGTYEDFLRCMNNRVWEHKADFPESYFCDGSEVHAGIFDFDGKGMLFTWQEFRKVKKWIKTNKVHRITCTYEEWK